MPSTLAEIERRIDAARARRKAYEALPWLSRMVALWTYRFWAMRFGLGMWGHRGWRARIRIIVRNLVVPYQ